MKFKFKPAKGFSHLAHYVLLAILPALVFILVHLGFVPLALGVIVLSKWRIFAVRPYFWPAIIRANAVDIMFGVSIVLFMTHSSTQWLQLLWAVVYAVWLLVIKPATGSLMITVQASLGQLAALMALFLSWSAGPLYGLVFATGIICFAAARHFFDNFDEPYAKLLSYFWGYFGAALVWILGHWLLFYGVMAQPTLILSVVGYMLAALYYLDHNNSLSAVLKRQMVFLLIAILIVIITFSDWGDKVV